MPLEAIGPMMRRAVEGRYAVGYFESGTSSRSRASSTPPRRRDRRSSSASTAISSAGRLRWRPSAWTGTRRWDGPRPSRPRYPAASSSTSARATTGCARRSRPASTWSCSRTRSAPADDLTRRVADLARLAHARGIAIEAELGELPCGGSGGSRTAALRPTRRRRRRSSWPRASTCWPSAWGTSTS